MDKQILMSAIKEIVKEELSNFSDTGKMTKEVKDKIKEEAKIAYEGYGIDAIHSEDLHAILRYAVLNTPGYIENNPEDMKEIIDYVNQETVKYTYNKKPQIMKWGLKDALSLYKRNSYADKLPSEKDYKNWLVGKAKKGSPMVLESNLFTMIKEEISKVVTFSNFGYGYSNDISDDIEYIVKKINIMKKSELDLHISDIINIVVKLLPKVSSEDIPLDVKNEIKELADAI